MTPFLGVGDVSRPGDALERGEGEGDVVCNPRDVNHDRAGAAAGVSHCERQLARGVCCLAETPAEAV